MANPDTSPEPYMADHYLAEVVADSIGPNGVRLTTVRMRYPRSIHAHWLKHRALSQNTASSRAVPTGLLIKQAIEAPTRPLHWLLRKSGMSGGAKITGAPKDFLDARILKLESAIIAGVKGIMREAPVLPAKEHINRYLEPLLWCDVIVTATDWANVFHLRCHPSAQAETQHAARLLKEALEASEPTPLVAGEWHLPYVADEEHARLSPHDACRLSAGRCARVSYQRQGEGDVEASLALAERLVSGDQVHATPFEHVAQAMPRYVTGAPVPGALFTSAAVTSLVLAGKCPSSGVRYGNFRGWVQYRYTIPNHFIKG